MSVFTLLTACSTVKHQSAPKLEPQARWGNVVLANLAETPNAGKRVNAILASHLHSRGIQSQATCERDAGLGDDTSCKTMQDVIQWARSQGVRYVIDGSVDEWRYRFGVDGEPAAAISLRIYDVRQGKAIWSGSGAKTGWGYQTLGGVTNKLVGDVLGRVRVKHKK